MSHITTSYSTTVNHGHSISGLSSSEYLSLDLFSGLQLQLYNIYIYTVVFFSDCKLYNAFEFGILTVKSSWDTLNYYNIFFRYVCVLLCFTSQPFDSCLHEARLTGLQSLLYIFLYVMFIGSHCYGRFTITVFPS